jgi:hypothetical protein
LNELQAKFGKKGLSIVGVTNEANSKVKPFITQKGIKYLIAIGNASGYPSRGIPAAWLVGANGKVIWQGHPASLKEAQIEEALKTVRIGPYFELPRALRKAQFLLNAKKYANGVKELEKYLKRPKDSEVAEKAKAAIDMLTKHGKSELELVEKKVAEAQFHVVLTKLTDLEKSFKGLETGKTAKARLRELKKDKELKLEMDVAATVVKAQMYLDVGAKGALPAARMLKKLTKQKKFADTKMLKVAEELLDEALSQI